MADSRQDETYRSLITISVEGFKFLGLLNGGATLSLLTYVGTLAGKTPPVTAPSLRCAFGWYIAGLVLCGFSFLGSYLTQFAILNQNFGDRTWPDHRWFLFPTMAVVVAGLVAFCLGSSSALGSLAPPVSR